MLFRSIQPYIKNEINLGLGSTGHAAQFDHESRQIAEHGILYTAVGAVVSQRRSRKKRRPDRDNPPWFLTWCVVLSARPCDRESVHGDLIERYHLKCNEYIAAGGDNLTEQDEDALVHKARRWYRGYASRSCFPLLGNIFWTAIRFLFHDFIHRHGP